jgi:hypothetical protein
MIITNEFVVINYPKTGTTFLRTALKAIHNKKGGWPRKLLRSLKLSPPSIRELMLPKLYGAYAPTVTDQHGVYRQIPPDDLDKKIVSIVRNPLTKYISSYVFGWWKKHPPFDLSDVMNEFPAFPELSFHDFYKLLNHPLVDEDKLTTSEARLLGSYARMFLVFYSRDPEIAVNELLRGQPLTAILPEITFIHQEFLQEDLKLFLKGMGYKAKDITSVKSISEMNVSSYEKKNRIQPSELIVVAKAILNEDKAIIEAFPEYGEQIEAVASGIDLCKMPTSRFTGPRTLGR